MDPKLLTICFFGFLFVQARNPCKKLKQNDFPEEYIKLYIGSSHSNFRHAGFHIRALRIKKLSII